MKSICRKLFAKTVPFLLVAAILLALMPMGIITTSAATADSSVYEPFSVVRSTSVIINGFNSIFF